MSAYCHGWEVRDEPIGILATGPASVHHVLLFRRLTDDLTYFTRGTALDASARARLAARSIAVIDTPVQEVVSSEDGTLAGVRLADGTLVPRRVLAVVTEMQARTEGLDGLKLPMEDLPDNMGRRFASGLAGATDVPGVWGGRQRHRPDRPGGHLRRGRRSGRLPHQRPAGHRGHRRGPRRGRGRPRHRLTSAPRSACVFPGSSSWRGPHLPF